MNKEKKLKLVSLAAFMYSFGMAFSLVVFGEYCVEVLAIAGGYFGLIAYWLWELIGE